MFRVMLRVAFRVLATLQTALASFTGVSVAPLGVHPTTGVDHGAANTMVFLDIFKHATSFAQYQPEAENYNKVGVWGPEYSASRMPVFNKAGYPIGLLDDKANNFRISVKATIGFRGAEVPGGQYVCTFLGDGELQFEGDAKVVSGTASDHRYVVNIVPSSGVVVRIASSSASNPVNSIRLVPLASESDTTTIFHPSFLDRLRGFDVIAFQSWFLIDDNG